MSDAFAEVMYKVHTSQFIKYKGLVKMWSLLVYKGLFVKKIPSLNLGYILFKNIRDLV